MEIQVIRSFLCLTWRSSAVPLDSASLGNKTLGRSLGIWMRSDASCAVTHLVKTCEEGLVDNIGRSSPYSGGTDAAPEQIL